MPLPKSFGIAKGWALAPGQVGAVAPAPAPQLPTIVTRPIIVGDPAEGEALTSVAAVWSNGPILTRARQWYQSSTGLGGWAAISGATGDSYTPGAGLVEKWLRLGELPTNAAGQGEEAFSDAVGPIAGEAPTYDYLAHNEADLTAALTTVGTGTAVIALAADFVPPASYTISNASTGKITIMGLRPGPRPSLHDITVATNAKNIRLEYLDAGDATSTTGTCISLSTQGGALPENIEIIDCDCYGQPFDPYGNYVDPVPAPTLRSGITGGFNNLTVRNCFFYALGSAIKMSSQQGDFTAEGNSSDLLYIDMFSLGTPAAAGVYTFRNNFQTRPTGLGTDKPDSKGPHCDFVQLTMTAAAMSKSRFVVEGNVKYQGETRASGQNLLASAHETSWYDEMRVTDNLWVQNDPSGVGSMGGEGHSPEIENTSAAYVARNRVLRAKPGSGTGLLGSKFTAMPGKLPGLLGDNAGENFSLTGAGDRLNNREIANNLTAYGEAFEGDGGDFTNLPADRYGTRENLIALKDWVVATYRPKADGALAHLRDVYDYNTGAIVDPSAERTYLPLKSIYEHPVSTVYETPWLPVIGGAPGQAISVPAGVRWRKASDSAGADATAYTAAGGTVDPWNYVKLDVTSSAAFSTAVNLGCTINGYVFSKVLNTAAEASFSVVDNQAAAWSLISPNLPNEASQRKAIIAFRYKRDVADNGKAILGSGSGSTIRKTSSTAKELFSFRSTSTVSVTSPFNVDTNWHTEVYLVDLTKTTRDEVFAWIRDYERIGGFSGTTDVNTEDGVNIQGTVTFSPASNFPVLQLLALSGASIGDGRLAFFWMHWADASFTMPDISDAAAFCNLFSADNIDLTDGSGPLGVPPKLFFHDDAAGLNAGSANKGSLGPSYVLTKQAGTYAAG